MRVRSLIFLLLILAILGGLVYAVVFQPAWLMEKYEPIRLTVLGYSTAKKPEDAMDMFAKAIKNRDYGAAAYYVKGEYADYLKKGKREAYNLAADMETLINLAERSGLNKDDTFLYLMRSFDPFPPDFKRPTSVDLVKIDDNTYQGAFQAEPITLDPRRRTSEIQIDPKMFRNAMMPPTVGHIPAFSYTVKIVAEGEGDNKTWKLDIPLDNITRDEINHMIRNYNAYHNAMLHLIESARASGSYDSSESFTGDVIEVLSKQR